MGADASGGRGRHRLLNEVFFFGLISVSFKSVFDKKKFKISSVPVC